MSEVRIAEDKLLNAGQNEDYKGGMTMHSHHGKGERPWIGDGGIGDGALKRQFV